MAISKKKLKIALTCTTQYSLPLKKKDRVIFAPIDLVNELVRGLVKLGHQVTLFASSDSKTPAKLVSRGQTSFAHHSYFKNLSDPLDVNAFYPYEQALFSKLYQEAKKERFDVIHAFHFPLRILPFTYFSPVSTLITLHFPGRRWRNELLNIYRDAPAKFISLSKAQRKNFPKNIKYAATVYNGLKINQFSYQEKPDDYLLITGRFRKDKGFHTAIKAAVATKHKIIIAGLAKVSEEKKYFKKEIKPLLKKYPQYVKNYGLLNQKQIVRLNKRAKAFLFPIVWEEPFGLVMIEAMACGTPVIAFDRGSVREVVKDKKTGFIVKDLKGMIKAIGKINQIKRKDCRQRVEKYFSLERMIEQYEKVYYKNLKK